MSRERSAVYFCAATVLIAWFASAAGVIRQPRPTRSLPAASDEGPLRAIVSDVQSQALRLRQRLAAAPAPRAPLRNPFQFGVRAASTPRPMGRVDAPVVEPVSQPAPADIPLALLGVAEQHTALGLVRTAMVGGLDGELYMAAEGQEVAGRYRVVSVGADVVELKNLVTGASRRLALK